MYNQVQGTYPQLAGSFYNAQGMHPHDNGRIAPQTPTFFGGLQNMMSASSAMSNYQNIPMGQSILNTQNLASSRFAQNMGSTIGHLGTGLSILGGAATSYLLPGMLGAVGGGLIGAAGLAITHGYNRRMREIQDMREALSGSRLGYGLANPITGTLSYSAANTLTQNLAAAARGSGFENNDLKKVMGTASGLGMLNGMQSLSQVTKRVTDLAKASRDIVMLGEGISMEDAMNLQKLTQDMGISTTKFRGMDLGKNLVMAARAARMSTDQAAQVGGMGAMTYQQAGLGAAAGMNAAFYTTLAAQGMVGSGVIGPRKLASLGGAQGLAQNLLAGQATTMSRMSDSLVMGAVKMDVDGGFFVDRELLDRYVRGDISTRAMIQRGKGIGKGLSKGQRNRVLESLNFAMPQLKESMGDMLTSEEQMIIQGRQIMDIVNRTGMSPRKAAYSYFQDPAQAEAFLEYSKNIGAVRSEKARQKAIADQERSLRLASMVKSSSGLARFGRGLSDFFGGAYDYTLGLTMGIGDEAAEAVSRIQDRIESGNQVFLGKTTPIARGPNISLPLERLAELSRKLPAGSDLSLLDRAVELRRAGAVDYQEAFPRLQQRAPLKEGLSTQIYEFLHGEQTVSGGDAWDAWLGATGSLNIDTEDPFLRASIRRLLPENYKFSDDSYMVKDMVPIGAALSDELRRMGELSRELGGDIRPKAELVDLYTKQIKRVTEGVAKGTERGVGRGQVNVMQALPTYLLEEFGTNQSKAQREAALGRAYANILSSDGEGSQGLNFILKDLSKVASHFTNAKGLSDSTPLDILNLGDGYTLESQGLTSAVYRSGMGAQDIAKLIQFMSRQGGPRGLFAEGASRPGLQRISRLANIDISKLKRPQLKGFRDLVESLRVATRYKTQDGERKHSADLVGGGSIGTIEQKTLQESIDITKEELEEGEYNRLTNQMEEEIGLGGQDLIRDLQSLRSISGRVSTKEFLEQGRRGSLTKFGTLTEALQSRAETEEKKKNYARFIDQNPLYEVEFQDIKREKSGPERIKAEKALINKIVNSFRKEVASTPGSKDKDTQLLKVLGAISERLDTQNNHLQAIATAKRDKPLEIKLV